MLIWVAENVKWGSFALFFNANSILEIEILKEGIVGLYKIGAFLEPIFQFIEVEEAKERVLVAICIGLPLGFPAKMAFSSSILDIGHCFAEVVQGGHGIVGIFHYYI
jgi:hypothetical protein